MLQAMLAKTMLHCETFHALGVFLRNAGTHE